MLIINILIGCTFAFGFLATISTVQVKRMRFALAYACIGIICTTFIYLTIDVKSFPTRFVYFLAFGIIWSQLLSRIFVQHQVVSPVVYMQRKLYISSIIIGFVFMAIGILMVLQPNRVNYVTRDAIFSEEDVYFRFSYLFLLIPAIILFFVSMMQRTAFCANGLFYRGLLWDWSNFKSYKWENDEFYQDANANSLLGKDSVIELTLYPDFKVPLTPAKFQFVVPYTDKEIIEKIIKPAFPSR